MGVTRTTLLAGPAAAIFGGRTFFAQDGILVSPALELDEVESDANGWLDESVIEAPVTIKFTPSAPFADLMALFPWLGGEAGASLFGTEDAPLVLIAANGVRLTFAAVAVMAMPDLHLTTRGPVAGAVTFLALGARSMPVSAMNRVVSIDIAEVPVAPGGTPQLADDFAVSWGGAPWLNLRSRDGVKIHFELTTKPVISDANALLDLTLERLAVEVRFMPSSPGGPGEADVFGALQVQGAWPGRLLSAGAFPLEIAGEHLSVRLPLAQMVRGDLVFDAVRGRVGELMFVGDRVEMEGMVELGT